MLVDTCVWLDLAKDPSTLSLIGALEELVAGEDAVLVVTRTILNEFAQNKARLVEDGSRSVSGTRMGAKATIERIRTPKKKATFIEKLEQVDLKLVTLRDQAVEIVGRIEILLAAGELYVTTDAIKLRASDRGIEKRAPFHRPRNGMNDAILVETYADMVAENKYAQRFAFVTHPWAKRYEAFARNNT